MALVIPNEGEVHCLDSWLETTTPEAQDLRLYVNDITPGETDTVATYTEASGGGYAEKALVRATWNAASAGAPSSKGYPEQTWSFSGSPGLVYGYYVVAVTLEDLMWAENVFASGQAFGNGDEFRLTLQITMD